VGDAFVSVSPSQYGLNAPLTFATVPQLRSRGLRLIDAATEALQLDLRGVQAVDSAGLALLIDWLAEAHKRGRQLRYTQPPPALLALAKLSEVEPLLQQA